MSDRGPPFAALRALEAACRLKSYSAAGEELGVTHSAISQSMRRLEGTYGQKLFHRQGLGMTPTAAAVTLAVAYRQAARIVADAADAVQGGEADQSLVLSTLPSIAKYWLGPRLKRLQDALPDIHVEVRTSRQLADLASDGVDVALRVGLGDWPGLRSELLFDEYVFPVCSPEFFEREQPLAPTSLDALPLIREDVDLWTPWRLAAGLGPPPTPARGPMFDDSALVVEAAAAGLGVALVRRLHAREALEAGRLVRISPVEAKDPWSCYLVWRESNPRLDAVRRFGDWVVAECDRAGMLEAA